MNAEYKKAAEKLLCGITDKRLHEPAIWNDILSSARSGNLQLWEINDEILRIKYFCKEKTERASAFSVVYYFRSKSKQETSYSYGLWKCNIIICKQLRRGMQYD